LVNAAARGGGNGTDNGAVSGLPDGAKPRRSLARPLREYAGRGLESVRVPARRVRGVWRRSLRVRVVATTVVLSLIVISLLGTFLVRRIADGLVDAKVDAALAQAGAGTREAQSAFDAADRTDDPNVLIPLADQLVRRLATSGGQAGRNEVLLVLSPTNSGSPETRSAVAFDLIASDADLSSIPVKLRAAVRDNPRQQWVSTTMRRPGGEGVVPAIAVGSRVFVQGVGLYELYYLFPLDNETASLSLVQRTLAVAGLALIALVGLIAYVVTRQVVTPVRMAARIAERLSAGRLEERMHVRGEDDLARLAASFNRMATNLQRQIRQLEDLSRVQRRFVSDVSHELRTPLTTVRMAADVIYEERTSFDPAVARSAELLQAQLDRFEALLADLLEISRFDAGAALLEADPVDLVELTRRVIDAHEPLAERKGSVMRLHGPAASCVAEVDNRRIERVLRNLVANAIEHGEGRPIDVYVGADAGAVAIAVRDHGVGLESGQAALVFNRFWRADPARARTTGGTGLGLSIALEDARLHEGWLQAWGEPDDGAQFRLTVPRRAGGTLESSPLPLEPTDSRRRRAARSAVGTGRAGDGGDTADGGPTRLPPLGLTAGTATTRSGPPAPGGTDA
jgi:two-component system sensor histidine kinase MtrB